MDGCQNPAVAIRRADAFANSVSQKGVEDASFWAAKASDYLRGYFHAAAIAGLDLCYVARWIFGTHPGEAEEILAASTGAAQYRPSSWRNARRGEQGHLHRPDDDEPQPRVPR